jgi:hypothetical protein
MTANLIVPLFATSTAGQTALGSLRCPAMGEAAESSRMARAARAVVLVEILVIAFVFFLNARWAVPDGNETYYLSKAKHFWNPAWGRGTLFLESGNAHAIFYILFGWLSRFVSFNATAWIVRGCAWVLLAVGWQRLSSYVLPYRGASVLSALLFVALNERAAMAGEWIVGGAEAKGFAYALVVLALWRLVRNDWIWVWPILGAATSMHPLVGGWAFAAMGIVSLAGPRNQLRHPIPIATGVVLALPGLWFALALNARASPAIVHRAAEIMVFERAPHHLLPAAFPTSHVLRQVALWLALALLMVFGRPFPGGLRRLQQFGLSAIGIALAGFMLSELTQRRPEIQATVLQYYWFRLSDAIVPAVIVLTLLVLMTHLSRSGWRAALLTGLAILGFLHLADRTRRIDSASAPRSDWMLANPAAWRDACAWVAGNTPATARFLTPAGGATFRWYSGRNDLVNWKDVPQDAAGVLTWWERMRDIHGPESPKGVAYAHQSLGQLGAIRLRQLGDEYDADYAIIARAPGMPALDLPEVYSNAGYSIVRLR